MDITRELNGTKLAFTLSHDELVRAHYEAEVLSRTNDSDFMLVLRDHAHSSNIAAALLISAAVDNQTKFYSAVHSAWRLACLAAPATPQQQGPFDVRMFESLALKIASDCACSFPQEALLRRLPDIEAQPLDVILKMDDYMDVMRNLTDKTPGSSLSYGDGIKMFLACRIYIKDDEAIARIAALIELLGYARTQDKVGICEQACEIFFKDALPDSF